MNGGDYRYELQFSPEWDDVEHEFTSKKSQLGDQRTWCGADHWQATLVIGSSFTDVVAFGCDGWCSHLEQKRCV